MLDPAMAPKPRSLDLAKHRDILRAWLDTQPGLVAELARDEPADITGLTINALEKRITARHAGVAPIPVWSGGTAGRVRMTRSGNRQLDAALHRIAITQARLDGLGRTYYRERLAAGDSNREALRCLKRRLARVVFNHLHTDHRARTGTCLPAAA